MKVAPLFAYLYASPLTQRGGDGRMVESAEELEPLNVRKEGNEFVSMFQDRGKQVRLRMSVACRSELSRLLEGRNNTESSNERPSQSDPSSLNSSPDVIHFTGHGFPDGYLALEDNSGNLDRLSTGDLHDMLQKGDCRIKLVFVSACFSEETGHVFANAGVKHVVAVRRDLQVADNVSSDFAVKFYSALLSGATVSGAFSHAQNCIQLTPGRDDAWRERQQQKFLLLPNDGSVDHNVTIFGEVEDGRYVDESPPLPTNTCIRVSSKFVGRRVLMQLVVGTLAKHMDSQCWLTLHGQQGIGKTSCAVYICEFLCERRLCKGSYFVPLENRPFHIGNTVEAMRTDLVKSFRTHAPGGSGIGPVQTETELFESLNVYSSSLPSPGPLVVVLDGCDEWIGKGPSGQSGSISPATVLVDFIQSLLAAVKDVSVLCTSRFPLTKNDVYGSTSMLSSVGERKFEVGSLPETHAAQLLVKLSRRQLTDNEISGKASSSIVNFLTSSQKLQLLAKHEVLRACAGHPLIIGQIAEKLNSRNLNSLKADALLAARQFEGESNQSQPKPIQPVSHYDTTSQKPVSLANIDLICLENSTSGHQEVGRSMEKLSISKIPSFDDEAFGTQTKLLQERPAIPTSIQWYREELDQIEEALYGRARGSGMDSVDLWSLALPIIKKTVDREFFARSDKLKRNFQDNDLERMKSVLYRSGPPKTLELASEALISFWKWLEATMRMIVGFHEYWNRGVIYGLISKESINNVLRRSGVGSFILRVSESCPGQLALAVTLPSGQVLHSLIAPVSRQGYAGSSPMVQVSTSSGHKMYATLKDFLLSCPSVTKLHPNHEKSAALQGIESSTW